MGSWTQIMDEIKPLIQNKNDKEINARRKQAIKDLSEYTGRNTIVYYSNWLNIRDADVAINDKDKNAFMAAVHNLDRAKGLDLILHTPGGDIAATESIVDYLHKMFGNNIRAIIPQLAMSAGTMIALSCKEIVMGSHSNLGPIDPQIRGISCESIIEEFKQAKEEVKTQPWSAHLWQTIINKYTPTLLVECQHAIDWSEELANRWLFRNMCDGDDKKAKKILKGFSSHKDHKSHSRHIPIDKCKDLELNVFDLSQDDTLQDLVLSIHHQYMIIFNFSPVTKIVENNIGISWAITQAKNQPPQPPAANP